jgi:hypothetical protein
MKTVKFLRFRAILALIILTALCWYPFFQAMVNSLSHIKMWIKDEYNGWIQAYKEAIKVAITGKQLNER